MTNSGVYFPGLNGLRFFAAIAVVITHIELIKEQMGGEGLWKSNKFIFELGGLGVIFFFVLSGFLITYLLFEEKKQSDTISVKKFYLRRIFRIWPLYYLVVVLGFFILPHIGLMELPFFQKHLSDNFTENLLLYIFMLPNLALAIFYSVPHIGQTWSIGVEEQFYLLWPWLVKYSKNCLKTLIVFAAILIGVKMLVLMLCNSYPDNQTLLIIRPFLAMTKMESMAIGGIGAWLLFHKKLIHKFYNNYLLFLCILSIPLLVYFTPDVIQDGVYILYSVLFLIIIINVSSNKQSIIKTENKLYQFLGNISFGIYMYHMMVIAFVIGVLKKFDFKVDNSVFSQFLVYVTSILLTVFMAWLSYQYFEKLFLKLKKRYTIIKSGLFS